MFLVRASCFVSRSPETNCIRVLPGTSTETQPVPRRNLRAHVPMLEARPRLKADIQTAVPFLETQSHHVLVRDRQTAAQHFADMIVNDNYCSCYWTRYL